MAVGKVTDAQLMAHFARLEGAMSLMLCGLAGLLTQLPSSKETDEVRTILTKAAVDLSEMAKLMNERVMQ